MRLFQLGHLMLHIRAHLGRKGLAVNYLGRHP